MSKVVKKKYAYCVAVLSFGLHSLALAHNIHYPPQIEPIWSPHVGIDYKYLNADPVTTFEGIFPKITNALSGYLGVRFFQYYNIDVGYEQTSRMHKKTVFSGASNLTGYGYFTETPDLAGDAVDINFKMRSIYLHLGFYYPFTSRLEGFLMVGLAHTDVISHIHYTSAGEAHELQMQIDRPHFLPLRWGFGAQYNFSRHFAVRAMLYREGLSSLKYIGTNQMNELITFTPYGDATVFTLGIVLS